MATQDPVKFIRLRLTNNTPAARAVVISFYAETVLGVTREQSHWHVQSDFDEATQTLWLRNPYHPEYGNQVAFVKHLGEVFSYTADRANPWEER